MYPYSVSFINLIRLVLFEHSHMFGALSEYTQAATALFSRLEVDYGVIAPMLIDIKVIEVIAKQARDPYSRSMILARSS